MKGRGRKAKGRMVPVTVWAAIAVVIVLALGLVFFYQFSADKGDGLEVTMEEGGVEEAEAVYNAPLDYGDNYSMSFAMGLVGFVVMVALVMGVAWVLPRRKPREGPVKK